MYLKKELIHDWWTITFFLIILFFLNHLYLRSIYKLFWTTEFTLIVTFTVVFHKCKELSSCHSYILATGYFNVKLTKKKQLQWGGWQWSSRTCLQKKFTSICFAVLNNRGPKHAAANMLMCFFLPFALDYTLC